MFVLETKRPLFGVYFIALLALTADGMNGRIPNHAGRIVGGRLAQHENFPYMVSIQKYKLDKDREGKWIHACGGSIINPWSILTACHCVAFTSTTPLKYKNAREYRIVAGVAKWHDQTSERQEIGAKKFMAHQKCNRRGIIHPYTYYDVGLIQLQSPLKYSFQVQPLTFFSRDPETAYTMFRDLQEQNANCLSPGWGRVQQRPKIKRSPHLKIGIQTLHTAKECSDIFCHRKNHPEAFNGTCKNLNKIEQACVTSKNASICNGDSGGPLVCGGYVFGVVSQVGSSCEFGGMQIFSSIRSILTLVNKYIPPHDA